jgi:hypothetical protein
MADEDLKPFFKGMPFDAASLNFTSKSISEWHRDFKNLVWGQCCIGPLGFFDHEKSAQFMMEETQTIVELRPGDLLFSPSGAIRHRNAPLKDPSAEERYAIVFYSAGGLFRWAANDFRAEKGQARNAKQEKENATRRWDDGWSLLPTLAEILSQST